MKHTQGSTSLLEQILAELDETRLATLYDEPIQKCCLEFLQTHDEPNDFTSFNQSLTEFMMLISNEALCYKINLPDEQAFSKAKRLLDLHYPGGGYERAYLDATLPNGPGHTTVLNALAEALITEQHTHHLTWTLAKCVTLWKTRLALVYEILQQHPDLLPPELATSPAWILVDQLPDLLGAITSTRSVLIGLAGA